MASGTEDIHESIMEPCLDSLQPSFELGNPNSLPPDMMMPLTTAAMLSQRRRRKNSTSLKRSASTPNVRGISNEESGLTLAEKRRNKLGYHRTSVACGHCRRRKIRCLLAPDDPQGRCANCIRLKKDCNFFPVDQQPQIERQPRSSSKDFTRASTSSESSPALPVGHPYDRVEDFNSYLPTPLSAPYLSSRGSIGGGLISPMTRVPATTQAFELPSQQRASWGSPFPDHGPTSAGHSSPGDSSQTYWGRHSDSPMTPAYSPHLSGPTSSHQSTSEPRSSFTSFAPSRTHSDSTWAVPSRSMSFGLVEDLPSNYQHYQHPQVPSMDFRRRASEMHPPSLQTSNNSSNASVSDSHMTPIANPISSPLLLQWGLPTTSWSNVSGNLPVTKAPDYGSWYGDPTPLAKVTEEEITPHFGGEPTILYAGGEHR